MNQENTIISKIEPFLKTHFDNLIKIYISERQANHNELGTLLLMIKEDKIDVGFLPISSPYLTKEVKDTLESKNNYRNSNMFIFIIDEATQTNHLMIRDLEQK